jgi:antimicrobial peptide system SdpA family protein
MTEPTPTFPADALARLRHGVRRHRLVVAMWLAVAGLGLAWVSALVASMPSNVVVSTASLPTVRAQLNTMAGQNFSFFTKSPQSEQFDVLRVSGSGAAAASLLLTPQSRRSNLYGLSRTQRAQGPELAALMNAVPQWRWLQCSEVPEGCAAALAAAATLPTATMVNASPTATVCGDVVFTVSDITKWSYRNLTDQRYRITRLVRADVVCEAGG